MSQRTILTSAAVFVVALGLMLLREAWATPPSGFTASNVVGPVVLEPFDVKSNDAGHKIKVSATENTDVYVTTITITPGGDGGWHSHPGPSIITVKSGEATFYDECDGAETPHVYAAGTGFVEEADCVHIVRNEGTTNLELVVVQIVPEGAPRRTDEQQP